MKKLKKLVIGLLTSMMVLGSSMTAFAEGIEDGWWEQFEDYSNKYTYTDEGFTILNTGRDGNTLTIYVYAETDNLRIVSNKTDIALWYYRTTDPSTLEEWESGLMLLFMLNPFNYESVAKLDHGDVWAVQIGLPNGYYDMYGTQTTHIATGGAVWNYLDENYEKSGSLNIDRGVYDHSHIIKVCDEDIVKYAIYGMPDWLDENIEEFSAWAKEDAAKRANDTVAVEEAATEETIAEETPEQIEETVTLEEEKQPTVESKESVTVTEETNEPEVETQKSAKSGFVVCIVIAVIALIGIILVAKKRK